MIHSYVSFLYIPNLRISLYIYLINTDNRIKKSCFNLVLLRMATNKIELDVIVCSVVIKNLFIFFVRYN